MLVFGVDIPLVEVTIALALVLFILLIEALIIIILLMKQMGKSKQLGDMITKLTETILEVKDKEIERMDKVKGRK